MQKSPKKTLVFEDIQTSFDAHPHLLNELKSLKGARLFLTGGTGFFGCWLLESLLWMRKALGIEVDVTLLTRDPEGFRVKRPALASKPFLTLHSGDVKNFKFPSGPFTHVIHAATEASAKLNAENPLVMLDTTIEGTRHALDFAVHAGAKRFLLTSSGAVYGRQPHEMIGIPESYLGGPDPLSLGSAYAEGKRVAEHLCAVYAKKHGIEIPIARCFAFVGPYLPLDVHFAIGNFILNAIRGETIQIGGDGTPYRSYLYGADLAAWLWGVFLLGESTRAYNVGSDEAVSIAELAHRISALSSSQVVIAKSPVPGAFAERYVPDTERARRELGLKQVFSMQDGVLRTMEWNSVI